MPGPEEEANDSFYVFIIAGLFAYIVPAGIWALFRILAVIRNTPDIPQKRSHAEVSNYRRIAGRRGRCQRLWTCWFMVHFVLLIVALVVASSLSSQLSYAEDEIMNPYDVLELPMTATDRQVKRAYRVLSLKYHPDKNPDNPEAAEKFMQLADAYKVLTDPVARANWEQYGNADGRRATRRGSAIPLDSIVQDKNKSKAILVLYFLGMVVLAVAVLFWQAWSRQLGSDQVLAKTEEYMTHLILAKQAMRKNLVNCLATAEEFMRVGPRPVTEPALEDVDRDMRLATRGAADDAKDLKRVEDTIPPPKRPVFRRNRTLLLAHLNRVEGALAADTIAMLLALDPIIGFTIKKASAYSGRYISQITNLMRLSQQMVQALPDHTNVLKQFPYVGERATPNYRRRGKSSGGKNGFSGLLEFLKNGRNAQTKVFTNECNLTKEEAREAVAVARSIPSPFVIAQVTNLGRNKKKKKEAEEAAAAAAAASAEGREEDEKEAGAGAGAGAAAEDAGAADEDAGSASDSDDLGAGEEKQAVEEGDDGHRNTDSEVEDEDEDAEFNVSSESESDDDDDDDEDGENGSKKKAKEQRLRRPNFTVRHADKVCAFDDLAIKVGVVLRCRDKSTEMPEVHAPYWPAARKPNWWLVLLIDNPHKTELAAKKVGAKNTKKLDADAKKKVKAIEKMPDQLLLGYKKLKGTSMIHKEQVKFKAPGAGKHSLTLMLVSDSYMGIDIEAKLELNVKERPQAEIEAAQAAVKAIQDAQNEAAKKKDTDPLDSDSDADNDLDTAGDAAAEEDTSLSAGQLAKREKRLARKAAKAKAKAAAKAAANGDAEDEPNDDDLSDY